MKRIKPLSSVAMAVALAIAVVLWMSSGLLHDDSAPPATAATAPSAERPSAGEPPAVAVRVRDSMARSVRREIAVSARTEPNRRVQLRAETDGRIVELGAERGTFVTADALIARLDVRDRRARIAEARALIEQRRLQYDAALRLKDQDLISDVQIAEARAQLISAQAALERYELDLSHTIVTAPFDAMLDERAVEIGDYVKSGDDVADLVDVDPLLIVGEVTERDIAPLKIGGPGQARLVDGTVVTGRIRYLAPVADQSTRTFRIELAVPNPEHALRAGLTAEMLLAADEITAHLLSPALLTLDDDGNVGVKSVDESNRVRYHPVEIVNSSEDGILVTGLPEDIRLITVGQGFVNPGQRVNPIPDPDTAPQIDDELTDAQAEKPARPGS